MADPADRAAWFRSMDASWTDWEPPARPGSTVTGAIAAPDLPVPAEDDEAPASDGDVDTETGHVWKALVSSEL